MIINKIFVCSYKIHIGSECDPIEQPVNSTITLLPDVPYEEYLEETSYFDAGSQIRINCSEGNILRGQNILTCQENGLYKFH